MISSRSAPALLALSWCALVATTIALRHAHATMMPFETPYETTLAFEIGTSDTQTLVIGVLVALILVALAGWDRQAPKSKPLLEGYPLSPRKLATATVLGVLALALLMLFRPMPEVVGECPKVVQLNSWMAFEWNCDSSWFQKLAVDPGQLLDEGQPRQGRPVYVLVGALLTYTLGQVASWVGFGQLNGEDLRPFVSLVLLNIVVLWLAVHLFARRLLRLGALPALTIGLAAFVAYNEVTAAWTWTPHQQTFTMLVPVVTVLAAARALANPLPWRRAFWWGLGIGVVSLAYGSWIVTVAAVGIALLVRQRLRAFGPLAALGAGFAVPAGGWILFCELVVGSYYNHEAVVYRQFVWVLDALRAGEFWERSGSYLLLTVREILGTTELWVAGTLVAVGIIVAAAKRIDLRPRDSHGSALLGGIAITAGIYIVFLWGMGFYTTRLSAGLIPLALFLAAWVFSRLTPPAAPAVVPSPAPPSPTIPTPALPVLATVPAVLTTTLPASPTAPALTAASHVLSASPTTLASVIAPAAAPPTLLPAFPATPATISPAAVLTATPAAPAPSSAGPSRTAPLTHLTGWLPAAAALIWLIHSLTP